MGVPIFETKQVSLSESLAKLAVLSHILTRKYEMLKKKLEFKDVPEV